MFVDLVFCVWCFVEGLIARTLNYVGAPENLLMYVPAVAAILLVLCFKLTKIGI